ncbi:FecR family protein [Pinibacter soli]|uniref:FecR family protein n=1 Tax=Pinibacter soli TaxID=3044211 RepID=A0ABT6RBA0_9BACT|nr:FecR family protein [Pinibacter soli]MDI3319857.1 FecR family protein [Pinibacter soli]
MRNNPYKTIGDFIADTSFRDWILHTDPAAEVFWHNWAHMNPTKQDLMENAKELLYILKTSGKSISDEEIEIEIEKILSAIKEDPSLADNQTTITPNGTVIFFRRNWWKVAAAAVIAVAGVWGFSASHKVPPAKESCYETFTVAVKKTSDEFVNTTDITQKIKLSDGSTVMLSPKSKFVYSGNATEKREIYLEGEALFDVAKNPSKPFIVYTNDLVTKVLGTSFWVKAYADKKFTLVAVKTGKVSVFKKNVTAEKHNATPYELGGLVVTPNQMVILDEEKILRKKITDKPDVLPAPKIFNFNFDSAPIKKVFAIMQEAYGINIVFDEEAVENCTINAPMGNETFYQKLDMICTAINGTYEIIDGSVVFSTKGCPKKQ